MSRGDPPLVYVGTDVGYVYRSIDGGVTWDELRLLPDDVPLISVSMIDLRVLRLPNDGLLDGYRANTPEGAFSRRGSEGYRPDLFDILPDYPMVSLPYPTHSERGSTSTYALGGGGARVETEDPGNLMASYFRGVASQPGRVNWLDICPTDRHVAYAGTNFGAFRTRDMGLTWDRVFVGSDNWENRVRSVHCHPEDANKVYLMTASGLRFSHDGGSQWDRPSSNLGNWPGYYVATHPADRSQLLVGTELGAYVTDGGATARELYLADTPSPQVRIVTTVKATSDENILYVGTFDGANYSHDGGRTWHRMGEFLIGHYRVMAISVDPRDARHAYIMTDWHLFETVDGGLNLRMLLPSHEQLFYSFIDPNDADRFWLLSWSNLRKLDDSRGEVRRRTALSRRAEEALARDPGFAAVADRTLAQAGMDDAAVQEYRLKIRRSSLVPTLNLVSWYYTTDGGFDSGGLGLPRRYHRYWATNLGCARRFAGGNELNGCQFQNRAFQYTMASPFEGQNFGAFMVLSWPLGRAVADERTTGRLWRDIHSMRDRIMYTIYDYWADRRRLLEYLAAGTNSANEEAVFQMRLAEMTAVVDGLTGGFLGGPFGDAAWEAW
jgi:photosystem II stability/assembly factor-like uncharacterized protein